MGPGTTWYFRRFAVARPRQKMEGGPKCNEPQGPIFLKKKWVGAVERRDAFHFSGRKGEGDAMESSTEERGEAASSIVSHRQGQCCGGPGGEAHWPKLRRSVIRSITL